LRRVRNCREITASGAVDVIEIDAASNRGTNEMRELRENVRYQPARDRYKVFIISAPVSGRIDSPVPSIAQKTYFKANCN
jgi:hypothetical protein